ncbi:hypothetical protein KN217_05230 [Stutzerimonas stutzeri]|nr:hypothetical protein [Stutzerimonas stutzeri]UVO19116.1 hypothetical protein KN217_05230 [Stutzerimonas stutzeri]
MFESIDRLITQKALLATEDGEGQQILTRAGRLRAGTALDTGMNILTGSASLDFKERFSEYICKGQRAGNDQGFGAAVVQSAASVTRRRVIELRAEG